jgi:hypothetical protein
VAEAGRHLRRKLWIRRSGQWTGEWLGTTMFFGHNSEAETLKCLTDSGLKVRDSSVEKQDNEEAAFMWVEAVKGQ